MACAQCGFANRPQAKFCGGCGASLSPHPPVLHRYTPAHLAKKVLASRSALEGERKQVTVLFADLKGSMELLADRDPEEARQLLDPVLERMMDAVHRYEGTVNQVMGDGIMALFGAPIGHEDHAVRACNAALAMQGAVKQYAAEVQRTRGVPIHIRVGLNAGEVVVRSIGSDLHMDYTVLQSLLGDDASLEPLKARLIERTQGNPFFLEESVQTWWKRRGWSATLEPIACPEYSRASRCRPRCRRCWRRASTGSHRGETAPADRRRHRHRSALGAPPGHGRGA
jgi:Adenylate and Guanylate cyclase catalytic domain